MDTYRSACELRWFLVSKSIVLCLDNLVDTFFFTFEEDDEDDEDDEEEED